MRKQEPYGKYLIVEKRDMPPQGWLINGRRVHEGWVVTDQSGMVNMMPGATWFETVEDAQLARDILDAFGREGFWVEWRRVRKEA